MWSAFPSYVYTGKIRLMNTRASFQEVTKDVSLKRGSWNGEGTYFYTLFWCKWTNRVFAVVIVIAYIVWNYQLMQWLTFPQHTPGGDKKKKNHLRLSLIFGLQAQEWFWMSHSVSKLNHKRSYVHLLLGSTRREWDTHFCLDRARDIILFGEMGHC